MAEKYITRCALADIENVICSSKNKLFLEIMTYFSTWLTYFVSLRFSQKRVESGGNSFTIGNYDTQL